MTEHFSEETTEESTEERRDILNLEDEIDALHESGGAKEGGVGIMELTKIISDDIASFVENGEETLGLAGQEAVDFNILCSAMVNGELNDKGREGDLKRIATWKRDFDRLYKNGIKEKEPTP